MKKTMISLLITSIILMSLLLTGCMEEASDEEIKAELQEASYDELNAILYDGIQERDKALAGMASNWNRLTKVTKKPTKTIKYARMDKIVNTANDVIVERRNKEIEGEVETPEGKKILKDYVVFKSKVRYKGINDYGINRQGEVIKKVSTSEGYREYIMMDFEEIKDDLLAEEQNQQTPQNDLIKPKQKKLGLATEEKTVKINWNQVFCNVDQRIPGGTTIPIEPILYYNFENENEVNNYVSEQYNPRPGSIIPRIINMEDGPLGAYAHFEGDDYIIIDELSLPEDFTVSFWIRFKDENINNQDAVIGFNGRGNDFNFFGKKLRYYNGANDILSSYGSVPLNTWTHYTISREDGIMKYYIYGEKGNFYTTYENNQWDGTLKIRSIGKGNAGNLQADLDELKVYDQGLNSLEILRSIRNSCCNLECPEENLAEINPLMNRFDYSHKGIMFWARNLYDAGLFPLLPYLTPVKDQGGRGTCGAFGRTAAAEIASHDLPDFSEQNEYYFAGHLHQNIHDDNSRGIGLEEEWPYNGERCTLGIPGISSGQYESKNGGTIDSLQYHDEETSQYIPCSDLPNDAQGINQEIEQEIEVDGSLQPYKEIKNTIYGFNIERGNPENVLARCNGVEERINNLAHILNNCKFPLAFGSHLGVKGTDVVGFTDRNWFNPVNDPVGGWHTMALVGYIPAEYLPETVKENPNFEQEEDYFIVKNSWSIAHADGGYLYVPATELNEGMRDADMFRIKEQQCNLLCG